MSNKTLGIDLGTNSIGWAIVENLENTHRLLDSGVMIFQEGVAREKGAEIPAVQTRTQARGMRRHYFRRRLMKIELLKTLIKHGFCPSIPEESLNQWRFKKKYPLIDEFIRWQRTTEQNNPYHARNEALSRKLDLNNKEDRLMLGRALYHLAQRRGFLSNRKEQTKESSGDVKQGIADLTQEMEECGCLYLGNYFHSLYQQGKKIRTRYSDRIAHTEKEFYAICSKQNLPQETIDELHRAIFFQRPLKSQKGSIGKCIFETNRSRCPVSHPAFEEYRMLAFINNIRVITPDDSDFRQLSQKEKAEILPLFFRKSKDSFDFEDIAKKIAGKGNYSFRDDKRATAYKFNYRMATSVSGCPFTTGLINIFGSDWRNTVCSCYNLAKDKNETQIINDVWHALYSFDSDEKLSQWAITNLQLDSVQAEELLKIKVPQGYASLSLKAINKILPHLRKGMRYDEAVFVANLDATLPDHIKSDGVRKENIATEIAEMIADFKNNPLQKSMTKQAAVRQILEDIPGIELNKLDRIYHPSKLDVYPEAETNSDGIILLGSPRTSSIRNPMAMRALFKLRHLINRLIKEGKIDRATRINIEFARGLNDSNMRKAIERYQRENEKMHKEYADKIAKLLKETSNADIIPSETDILKYQLWEEQGHQCLYTGEQISITDFISSNPKYDIEHTIPRSIGGDDSQANKTLCSSTFNRQIKKTSLPSQLSNHSLILERIDNLGWNKTINDLNNEIARIRTANASTKDIKDAMIQKKHYLKMKLNYWKGKVDRFSMTEVPEGFSNRQGVDIGIIGKYAREYLRTLFRSEERQIFTVKGMTTAEFRKMWGLQDEYSKKERINHTHHAIDAIVIACIGRHEYQLWAEYTRSMEDYDFKGGLKPHFEKPWASFTEDVKEISRQMLIVHDSSDNTLKPSKKALRKRGKICHTADGDTIYQQGDTARASLHKQTYYGAINLNGDIKYVLRVPVDSLKEKDIDKIVDPAVKEKVMQALQQRGFKNLFDAPIWMNEEKGIAIKKVRVFTPSITSPIHLKKHRDESKHPYKQAFHVANDSNYCMGIYEGYDHKNKRKRSFAIVNNLDAVKLHKSGADILPLSDPNDLPLKWILKVGTLVLFYENSPAEVYECSQAELARRLYVVSGLTRDPNGNGYGKIYLRFHQEARPSSDSNAKNKNGTWTQGENIRPGIIVLHTQFNALVQGQDFIISESGTIKFLHSLC